MTREHTALPNANALPDPAPPPRLVLNRQVYAVAGAANRAGITVPGLPEVYQYGQRQHEVGTLCAGLSPPFPFLDLEQRAAHEAARAVCNGRTPRPKRTTTQAG